MAYKYLNDNGLKAYTKKVKGALKDLHTPIAISSENTTESKAQNVRNIEDFVAKAKAAGIADVNGMAVTCLLSSGYSGVGYLHFVDGNYTLQGVEIQEELDHSTCFLVWDDGSYKKTNLITGEVTSQDLTRGARKPIILTPETTEVDEETYQKLLIDDVDVVFKTSDINYCYLTYKYEEGTTRVFCFTALSVEGFSLGEVWLYGYRVYINNTAPHEVSFDPLSSSDIFSIIKSNGFINQSILTPVLQEIDLTGTDAQRKAKLTQFEIYWKALTGASDMKGARFVGKVENSTGEGGCSVLFTFDYATNALYYGCTMLSDTDKKIVSYRLNKNDGSLSITPLFSHLEPVEIFFDNTAEKKKKNLDNLNAYKANLEELGVDTSISFQVVFQNGNGEYFGNLYNSGGGNTYIGLIFTVDDNSVGWMRIYADGEVVFVNLASEDAIKYSYTPVPLTATASTNKTQLDLFLSKVPNAQVMHCTYKDVYAGTLHKINGSWYGVLVGESNTIAGQLSIKLQADGTIVEGTT